MFSASRSGPRYNTDVACTAEHVITHALALLLMWAGICVSGAASASNVPVARARFVGHPKDRFPLTVYIDAPARLDTPIREAITQWNSVFRRAFGMQAFVATPYRPDADIIIIVKRPGRAHAMGATNLDADSRGVICLPVTITIAPPTALGGSSARQVMFDVTAHELGHALGLPHINSPGSIMCCEPGSLDFSNPAVRDAYIAARRRPNMDSVIPALTEHYRHFWSRPIGNASSSGRCSGSN